MTRLGYYFYQVPNLFMLRIISACIIRPLLVSVVFLGICNTINCERSEHTLVRGVVREQTSTNFTFQFETPPVAYGPSIS